jgi:hypothetical protein
VLNLEVPLEVYRDAVVPSDLFCPLLEELKIQVYTLYLTTNHENVLELMVAPLINRHSRTLTTLHLVDSRGPYRYLFYRYERLFRALTVFPRLSALSVHFLVYPIESRCLDALGRFIHLHHSSLHTLNLNLYHTLLWNYDFHVMRHHRLYDSSSLFRHGLFTRALPECSALTQLELVLLARDAFETGSAPLLSWFPTLQCTAKLTTLSLPYNTLTQSNLISLLNSTDLSSLRSLRVETRSFNMDLFDALAVTLHRLHAANFGTWPPGLGRFMISVMRSPRRGVWKRWAPGSFLPNRVLDPEEHGHHLGTHLGDMREFRLRVAWLNRRRLSDIRSFSHSHLLVARKNK